MKGHKIALAVGAVLIGLLCLAGAWITYTAFAKAGEVKHSLDGYLRQFQAFYNKNPFPCSANMGQFQTDEKNVSEWTHDLDNDLLASQPKPTSDSPSQFGDRLLGTVRALRSSAASNNIKLPAESAAASFGFSQYLGATGGRPKPDDVPRLSLQLAMTDLLIREIFASHIKSLDSVDREMFDNPTPATSLRSIHRPGQNIPVPVAAPVVTAGNSLYNKERFTIAFSSNEHELLNVLSHLAAMSMFAVVTDLETTREDRGVLAPPEKNAISETNRLDRLDRAQRLVSGPEISSPLKTRLTVDVYTFTGV